MKTVDQALHHTVECFAGFVTKIFLEGIIFGSEHLSLLSLLLPLSNKFLTPTADTGEVVLAVNPVWAARFGAVFPDIGDMQSFLVEQAWQPIDLWPPANREILERQGRVDDGGRVHLCSRPDQFVVIVCGGQGSLHAIGLPSWGESAIQSVAVER